MRIRIAKNNTRNANKRVRKNALMRTLQPELKMLQVTSTGVTMSQVGGTVSLSNIPQGSDITSRIGRHVRALYIDYSFRFTSNVTSIIGNDVSKIDIFVDRQANNATPAITDTWMGLGTLNYPLGQLNTLQYRKRFKVLLTIQKEYNNSDDTIYLVRGRVVVPQDCSDVEFIGSSTGVAASNNLFMSYGCDNGSTVTAMSYQINTYYYDA